MASGVDRRVRLGVVGCADIARRRMLPAFAGLSDVDIVAVASRDGEKAGKVAADYGCEAVTGYEKLLGMDLDAVYVPLPAAHHAVWIERALRAGKHVLAEKPVTPSLEETADLVAQARERGLVLRENFLFPFHSQHHEVRRLVLAGAVGEVRAFEAAFTIPPRPSGDIRYRKDLAGGALLDVGVYPLKAAMLMLGPGLQVLGANLKVDATYGVDVSGSVLLRAPGGVTAQLTFGMEHTYRANYSVWGSESHITVDRAYAPPADLAPIVRLGGEQLRLEPDDQYTNAARSFVSAVRTGGPTSCESIELAQLVDAVVQAAR
ncbi:Gfo/Idh/MocA family protein [Lentzea rhizosphaerae]|uniref:Gfo/Idh/MocA family protein n=1 Tax=Lentzea rhizosphaerae TaxID=2041025 RepID=A0ABV8BXB1_9PSEU